MSRHHCPRRRGGDYLSIAEKGKATRFKTGAKQVEIARKGGKASGASKAKKKNMREALDALLNGTYTEPDGSELTGMEKLMATLFKIATDPDHKQCIQALRLIREMLGEDITPEQIRLLDKKIEQMDADIAYRKKATEEIGF